MSSSTYRRPQKSPNLPFLLAACAFAFAFAAFLLIALSSDSDADDDRRSIPRCAAVSSRGHGDYVPTGARPCVLHQTGTSPSSGSGPAADHGTVRPASPGAAPKVTGKPTAPAAKAPAAPKAPAPAAKAPSLVKTKK
ncbi:hypothetical protein [Streptomyces sp. NPDC088915]|uniref:hypothetical protein n=1 Tax=Streptomyces sp. NPDC088915 TaxID=3365912 RepID=UPI003809FDFC